MQSADKWENALTTMIDATDWFKLLSFSVCVNVTVHHLGKSTEKQTLSFQETTWPQLNLNHWLFDQEVHALIPKPHCP